MNSNYIILLLLIVIGITRHRGSMYLIRVAFETLPRNQQKTLSDLLRIYLIIQDMTYSLRHE